MCAWHVPEELSILKEELEISSNALNVHLEESVILKVSITFRKLSLVLMVKYVRQAQV